jgi:hypothetical protein
MAMPPIMFDTLCTDCETLDVLLDRMRKSEEIQLAFEKGLLAQKEHDEADRCGYGPGQAIRTHLIEAFEKPS